MDEDSGYPYYENRLTGEVLWEKPDGFDGNAQDARVAASGESAASGAAGGGQWVEKMDEDSGYPYYENQVTGELLWEKPEGFDDQVAAGSAAASDTSAAAVSVPYEWEEKTDDDSGYPYYENRNTGEMLWEKPDGFDEGVAAAAEKEEEEEEEEKEDPAAITKAGLSNGAASPLAATSSAGEASEDDGNDQNALPPTFVRLRGALQARKGNSWQQVWLETSSDDDVLMVAPDSSMVEEPLRLPLAAIAAVGVQDAHAPDDSGLLRIRYKDSGTALQTLMLKARSNREAMRWAKALKRRCRRMGNVDAEIHILDSADTRSFVAELAAQTIDAEAEGGLRGLQEEHDKLREYELELCRELERLREAGGDRAMVEHGDESDNTMESDSENSALSDRDAAVDKSLNETMRFVKLREHGTLLMQVRSRRGGGFRWVQRFIHLDLTAQTITCHTHEGSSKVQAQLDISSARLELGGAASRHQFQFEVQGCRKPSRDTQQTVRFRGVSDKDIWEWAISMTVASDSTYHEYLHGSKIDWRPEILDLSKGIVQTLALRQIMRAGETEILLPKASAMGITFRRAREWALVNDAQCGIIRVPEDSILSAVNGVRLLQKNYDDTVELLEKAPALKPLRLHLRPPPSFSARAAVCTAGLVPSGPWEKANIEYGPGYLTFTVSGDIPAYRIDLSTAAMSIEVLPKTFTVAIRIADTTNDLFINVPTIDNFVEWATVLTQLDMTLKGGNLHIATQLDLAVAEGHSYDSSSESEDDDDGGETEKNALSLGNQEATTGKLDRADVPELADQLRQLLAQLPADDSVVAEDGVPDGRSEGARAEIRECSEANHRTLLQLLEQGGDKLPHVAEEHGIHEGAEESSVAPMQDARKIKSLKDWAPTKTKSRFAGRSSPGKPRKPARRDPAVDLGAAEKLGHVVLYLLANPTDIVGAGMGLPSHELGAYAAVVVHGLYSRYTQDSSDLMTVLREASLLHAETFGMNDHAGHEPVLSLSFDSSDVPTSDSFLAHLLRNICGREEVLAFADSAVRVAKGPQNPQQSESDHREKAFLTVSQLVVVLTGMNSPAMPSTLASVCHVLKDNKTRITPRHILLYYVLLPALNRAMTGDWQCGVRPGSATDYESARSEVTRIYAMFLHTVMLATPVPSLPLKQRASLASLQILMGTYFQRILGAPRRWALQRPPGLFPGSFCSPWSKPVDLCSAVILTGAEALILCDAFHQHIGVNRQASDSMPETTYASLTQICDRSIEIEGRQPYLIGTESGAPPSPDADAVPPDPMGAAAVELDGAATSAAVARCQIILHSAHDQLRAATAGSEGATSGFGDGLVDSLSEIISQVEQNFVMLESFLAESRRLQAALSLAKSYSQQLQLHRQLAERSLAAEEYADSAEQRAFLDNAAGQLADILYGEVEHETTMEFKSAFDTIDGTEDPDGGAAGPPFSPTSPLATLMSTVFSPMNIF